MGSFYMGFYGVGQNKISHGFRAYCHGLFTRRRVASSAADPPCSNFGNVIEKGTAWVWTDSMSVTDASLAVENPNKDRIFIPYAGQARPYIANHDLAFGGQRD